MKLLFYSPVFPPRIGGIETIVYSISTGLAELRGAEGVPEFEITFVTQTPAGSFNDAALPFRMVRNPGIGQLRQLIQATDVLHIACPALGPMLLGYLAGKPTVIEHHGFQNICPTGQLLQEPVAKPCPGHFMAGRYAECLRCRTNSNWPNSVKQLLSTWVRRFIAPRVFANIMPTDYLGSLLQLPNAITIHHGIQLAGEPGSQFRSRIPSPPIRLLYQGRLVSTKGIGTLIDAVGLLHQQQTPFDLVVIGDGPEREALESRAQHLGVDHLVRFAGRLSDEDVAATVADVDIIIVPSLAGEVFGLVVAENMARGLAVVTSDIGAFTEVLGSAGRTFKVGDPNDLANQLEQLIRDPGLLPGLGDQAKFRVFESFERSKMVAEHAALYRKAFAAQ